MLLDTSIDYLKGVGPSRADLLKRELGIFTYRQLLQHYPFRYVDKTKFHRINSIGKSEDPVQIRGILRKMTLQGDGRKRRLVGTFRDNTGVLELVWFKGIKWIQDSLKVGAEYVIYGTPNVFNGKINIVHPEIELMNPNKEKKPSTLEPIYHTTDKLRAKRLDAKGISKLMQELLKIIHSKRQQLHETLPLLLINSLKFPTRWEAMLWVHFPINQAQQKAARNRLKFEELFFMQLRILRAKGQRKLGIRGFIFEKIGTYFNTFYKNNLKFDLTGAQKRVLREIRQDMRSNLQMNRLLQGDVGSGKTVVGFMSILMALDNDFQAAMIAPTEILAQQHFESLQEMAAGLDIRIEILTGSTKTKARRTLLEDLAEGKIQILLGTHALLEDKVIFKNLGLAIVDEQHRFGVAQRAKMWRKNKNGVPHILVMTATPIPRTLAMTVYGDLDVSVIDEMPPGRKPIQTFHKYENTHRLWVFGQMKREIAKGHQVYVVYPLIEDTGKETMADIKNLDEGHQVLSREFPMPQYQISVVHGRQKPEDKEFEMQRFIKGETQIMIATTVIEVGVNVPNATMMIIENAERFGLAQLHQLRGRVGRGGGDAYCILITGYKLSSDGKFRMKTMTETTDGFKISEADLKLRGPGNIEGTQQSGILSFKIADLVKDGAILREARKLAAKILEDDPNLEHEDNRPILFQLNQSQTKKGFGRIS
ncbi:MAG: ATP-dependent DNA helicase RecG [Saprospiraceae bacterium]|nr:ATP-dependent DNA helicase RecG [Saprospiraceae bacterium]